MLLLPTQFLMLKGYQSLDGLIHQERIRQFHQAIGLGQFPVRLAPSLMNEIGYPLFIVNYQLPYYWAEVFILIKDDPKFAYKTVMSTSFILSGIFAFFLFRNVGSNIAALTGAIIFSYLPYRFGNLYMRGAFGESVSIMFIPLILLSFHKIAQGSKFAILLLAVSIFGFITSHTITFLLFAPFFALYIPSVLKAKKRTYFLILLGIIYGFALASFQILPSVFEKKYMLLDQNLSGIYTNLFINFYQLLRIPKAGINTGTYLQLGIAATLILFVSLIVFIKNRNRQLLFFLTFAFISIFATQKLSLTFWENLPLLGYIAYPYRFLLVIILSSSFLAVYLVEKSKYKLLVAGVLILMTLYTNRHYIKLAPGFEIKPPEKLTTLNENDTIWSNAETFKKTPLIETIPQTQISNLSAKPFEISFETKADIPAKVVIRKMYFPGWELKINGQKRQIDIENGLIGTRLLPGSQQVNLYFTETPLRTFANMLSLAAGMVLIIIFIIYVVRV